MAYNSTKHRAIGVTQKEAVEPEMKERVHLNGENYKKEFETHKRRPEKLKLGELVLIKNEKKFGKMRNEFSDYGVKVPLFLRRLWDRIVSKRTNTK